MISVSLIVKMASILHKPTPLKVIFSLASGMALEMAMSVCLLVVRFTTLVQAEISQQQFDELPSNFILPDHSHSGMT